MTLAAPSRVIIGLDVGATGVKAAAFGRGSSWYRMAIREYPLLEPVPGEHVQDPSTIVAAAATALADCAAAIADTEVVGISVSVGMHGLVALDADRALTPLITWADGRSEDEARSLHRLGHAAKLHAATGVPVHPMTPLTKLMWFARHDPTTWISALWWVGLKEYVLLWLTDTLTTELSSASGTGLLDLSTRRWSPLALDTCGVDADQLPRILPTTATLALAATAARDVGLPAGTPDRRRGRRPARQPRHRCDEAGRLRAVARHERRRPDGGERATRRRRRGAVLLCPHRDGVGGRRGDQQRRQRRALAPGLAAAGHRRSSRRGRRRRGRADEAVLELAASVPAGSEGLVMFPYLLPERAPLWDPDLHGAYVGLRRRHTRAHFVRAAVEGVCLQMRLILDSLDELEPRVVHRSHGHWLAYLLQKRRSPAWHGSICSKDRVVCLGFRGVPSGAYLGQLDGTGWTSRLRTSW